MNADNIKHPIRILIVDDHQIIRDGVRALLRDTDGIEIVAEAENGAVALERLKEVQVDVVVMDINMPVMNGIEATQQISERYPEVQVLILTMHDDIEYISNMLKAGAAGYILKSSGKPELITAIQKTAAGDNFFSSEVSFKVMKRFMANQQAVISGDTDTAPPNKPEIHLTKREIEIIRMIGQELTNQQIADRLSISPRTVDTHRRNLLQKLGVRNTAGLIRYALQHQIID
jgi:DNA-binding NarL/FixJ family response regulator